MNATHIRNIINTNDTDMRYINFNSCNGGGKQMEKVFGYIRVSTINQAREGYSLSYQREEINRYCKENNLDLVGVYEDAGISGAKVDEDGLTVDREALQQLLCDLKTNDVKYIVVLNTSRIWRSDMVKVLIHRELKKQKIDIKSIEQSTYSIYVHDPNDFLVNGMLELLDQYQRLEIALKLGRGRNKKAKHGGYAGGGVAFGYTAKKGKKKIEVDEKQAKAVQRLFEIKESYSTWSLSKIADKLNEEGYKTAKDKYFTKVQVKRILDRKAFYSGIYRYGNIEAKGKHKAII